MTAAAKVLDGSNWLADLAARIKTEHEATAAALQSAVVHAMAAGDLLIEAKAKVPHGQWLPWCEAHCPMSERTIQLYMKLAKNRATIEREMKSADIADLTIAEAAALCVLAGRIDKLVAFAKRTETTTGQDLVNLCVQQGFETIQDKSYDPFAGRSEAEQRDWVLFGFWIGNGSESAFAHVEWLLQRPFQNIDEWLGPEGDKCRARWGMPAVTDSCRAEWAEFKAEYADKTLADIDAEIMRNRAEAKL